MPTLVLSSGVHVAYERNGHGPPLLQIGAGLSIALLYHSAWVFVGDVFALKAFVCMLVAGNRNVEGVVVVGLGIGIIEALVIGYISSNLVDAVAFVILIGVLYYRPAGLFGSYHV